MTKILFVVGAGASCEVDLPGGDGLKSKIREALDFAFDTFVADPIKGDPLILECLRGKAKDEANRGDVMPYVNACWRIRDAMPQAVSIDNFIDQQADLKIELCGKLAIARTILKSERGSKLYIDESPARSKLNHDMLQTTWFNRFWQLVTSSCRPAELDSRMHSIAMIVFNYDRCIEHYLYHSFQTYYRMEEQDAAALVNSMEIYHPYGTVGSLPWQGQSNHQSKFGAEPRAGSLLNLAAQIKTFTEGTDPASSEICSMRERIMDAEKIVFLGFAFHRQNIELLWPRSSSVTLPNENRRCFATSHGLSDSSIAEVRDVISGRASTGVNGTHIKPGLKCFELFHEYSIGLSIA